MASITPGQTPRTKAMFGSARSGSARFGYISSASTDQIPPSPNPFYRGIYPVAVAFTEVER